MKKSLLLSATCALALMFAVPAPAQQISTIPLNVQQSLRSAASLGPNQLKTAVYNAVQKYPGMAQSIVNEAARYQPSMGQSLADIANTALREQQAAARAVQMRAAQKGQAASTGSKAASYSAGATPSGGIGGWGWAALGVGVAGGGAMVALSNATSENDPPSPAVVEFNANFGLNAINAESAYARAVTGNGTLVAVADTGIDTDHPEFATQLSGGYNAFTAATGTAATEDDPGGTGHGTFVAGIIAAEKNNVGMHGVAYNASILPIKVFDNLGAATSPQFVNAINYAVAQGADVWNGSYGFTGVPDIAAIETELDAYQNAISNGMILVFAAGNSSFAEPDLPAGMPYITPANNGLGIYTNNINNRDYSATASQLLAVVSVDNSGVISSFSNACGIAAAWCLAAPGGNVYSTTVGGSYGNKSGTSFAAPHVAGAAALLIEQYPSLTPAQVTARILTTATKAGIYANQTLYGQGLLNLTAATAFVANPLLVSGGNLRTSRAYSLSASQFRLAAPFGDGLRQSLAGTSFKPVDSFDGAAISTPAGAIIAPIAETNSLADSVRRFGSSIKTERFEAMGGGTVRWQQVPGNDRFDPQVEARLTTSLAPDTEVTVGYMDDPALGFGLSAEGDIDAADMLAEGAFLSPYLSFAQDGINVVATTDVGGVTLRGGSFNGNSEGDRRNDAFGAAGELAFTPYEGANVSVQAGFVSEARTFLGTENDGAFAIGETMTTFAGVSARLPVAHNTELVGSFFLGTTQVDPADGSLLAEMSGITSDAFSLGVVQRNMVMDGDRFGLTVNQPLRVSSGSAALRLPGGVGRDLNITYNDVYAGLTPSGREVNLEAFYRAPLDQQTDLNASIMYRHQPGHIATADDEVQTLVRWQRRY
jgi:subtilisin family serine protease